MTITLYRCYWPAVYYYLKPLGLERCVEDSFGHVLSLKLSKTHIHTIMTFLPIGAVIEVSGPQPDKDSLELEDILLDYGLNPDNEL